MKNRKILFIPICLLLLICNLASCGVDRWPEYASQTAQDEWIDSVMRKNYLWYYEIPQNKNLNFFTAPSAFLQSLLYQAKANLYSQVRTVLLCT